MARPRKLNITKEMLDQMYTTDRMTASRIAASLGVSVASIHHRLREFDITPAPAYNLLPIHDDEIRQMYSVDLIPMHKIAAHFKCSKGAIRDRVVRLGLSKVRTQVRKPSNRFRLSEAELRELYLDKKMSDMAIGRQFDLSNLTIANWRKRYGIKREEPLRSVCLDEAELKWLYIDEKQTMEQMAEYFGCGESTVRENIIRAGLNIDAVEVAQRRIERNKQKYTFRYECDGYRMIHMPEHPSSTADGYIREHRYLAEVAMGRYLRMGEQVHHINVQKLDNRVENLAVVVKDDHSRLHKYMERVAAFAIGLSGAVRPEPLAFGKPCFWAGAWVKSIDLLDGVTVPAQVEFEGEAKPLIN